MPQGRPDADRRADVGAVTVGQYTVSWAAIGNWDPAAPGTTLDHFTVWAALPGMRRTGEQVLAVL